MLVSVIAKMLSAKNGVFFGTEIDPQQSQRSRILIRTYKWFERQEPVIPKVESQVVLLPSPMEPCQTYISETTPSPHFIYFNNAASGCNSKAYHSAVLELLKSLGDSAILAIARLDHLAKVPLFRNLSKISEIDGVFPYVGSETLFCMQFLETTLQKVADHFEQSFPTHGSAVRPPSSSSHFS